MREPTYRDAIKAGWQLAWHHKSLWIFGMFAAFLGQMGIVELLSKMTFGVSYFRAPSFFVYAWDTFSQAGLSSLLRALDLSVDKWVWLIWLIIIFIGFGIFLAFVAVVSQGAIVHSATRFIEKNGKKFESTSVSWDHSRKHFWKLFGLNVLRKCVLALFISFVVWGTFNALIEPSAGDIVLFFVLFLMAAMVGMVLSFLLVYAVGYVVVEEFSFIKAIRSAWRLFTRHWFVSFEIGFIFIILNIVFVVIMLLGMYLLFLPSLALFAAAFLIQSTGLYTAGIILGFVLFIPFIVVLGSVFTVFGTATWTYLFTKMHREGIISHLVHLFHGGK
ncbi:MAG TPA: hypothetical protein DCS29_02260 [Candidatus Magasanikbacteria bacterium]|nr:MAG: hypothetical protein A2479_00580 [Candidatus Magasanikbacteria bacterium RIFOXYC2_FULL_39_8]HAT03580.1 hypothetical protein [Candidatus Magasanikbacteria bacterium]